MAVTPSGVVKRKCEGVCELIYELVMYRCGQGPLCRAHVLPPRVLALRMGACCGVLLKPYIDAAATG